MCEPVSATMVGTAAASSLTAAGSATLASAGLSAASVAGASLAASTAGALTTTAATSGLLGAGGVFSSSALMTAGSFLTSAYGMYQQSEVAAANYKYQAGIHAYNARVGENNAMMAEWAAEKDADTFDTRLRQIMAAQDVGAAKSGVVINQDSPLSLAATTAQEGALERLSIIYGGTTAANAYRAGSTGQSAAAARQRANASSASNSAIYGIAGRAFQTGKTLLDNA